MSQSMGAASKQNSSQRRVVLSENEYTSTLENIVQRDYFPDLPELQRQAAVLEKRAAGDIAGAVAVRRAASQLRNHEETLAGQEEQDEHDLEADGGNSVRKTPRPLHRENVTGFHARVTSEDNAEFDHNQLEQVKETRRRVQEAFQQSNPLLQISSGASNVGSETPLLASDKFSAPLNRIEASQWKEHGQQQNSFFFTPPHHGGGSQIDRKHAVPLLSDAKDDHDAALMPPPAPVQTAAGNKSHGRVEPKQILVEYVPKHATERRIEPSQTRFSSNSVDSTLSLCRTRNFEREDSSHRGYTTDGDTSTSTDLDEGGHLTLSQERVARLKRARREQESLVAMTPLVVPGRSFRGEASSSPIMTWGTVDSTPLVLGGMDTSSDVREPKSFVLPEESYRDEAARQAEKKLEHAKRRRTENRKKSGKAVASLVDPRSASLTPAAQSLLEKGSAMRPQSCLVRSSGAFASALRSSYTPKVKGGREKSMGRDHALKATPRKRPSSDGTGQGRTPLSRRGVTDGLLQLPKND